MTDRKLFAHQEYDVAHLLSMPYGRPAAILGNGPGTGKTISAIEAAKRANCTSGIILCPSIVKQQWRHQMLKWELCGEDEIQIVNGLDATIDNRPWVIINYDIIRDRQVTQEDGTSKKVSSRNRKQLFERKHHCLVEDECHNLKNYQSAQAKAVLHRSYGIANSCYYKWALSGTLMPNRPIELYSILRTHFPETIDPYITEAEYIRYFCGGAHMAGRGASHVAELTERIQKVFRRVELEDVWRDCPDLLTNEVYLDVPYWEHPEFIGEDFMPEATLRRIVAEAKIPHTVAYIENQLEAGIKKLCVFTYHQNVITGLEKALAKYNPVKICGEVSSNKREQAKLTFRTNPDCRLILLQIMSAGEGVDGLQDACHHFIRSEPEWCPGREDQAGRRILRLGQLKDVVETKLIATNSYEDVISGSAQRKRKVIDVVLKPNGGNFCMSIEDNVASIARDIAELKAAFIAVAANQGNGHAPAAAAPPIAVPPATLSPPVPVAPVSAPVAAPPAPIAAPVATPPVVAAVPTSGMTRDAFEKAVGNICNPYGANAVPVLRELYGSIAKDATGAACANIGDLPPAQFEAFIASLSQRLPTPKAA